MTVAALVLTGCSADGAPGTDSSATSTAAPDSTFQGDPVNGEVDPGERPINSDFILGLGQHPEKNDPLILDTISRTKQWLDQHLTAVQNQGGDGLLANSPVYIAADGGVRQVVTTHLASPDRPVAGARYRIIVYHDPTPRFVEAQVTTAHPEGEPTNATFGFLVLEDGSIAPSILGAEVIPPPPAPETPASTEPAS